MTLKQTFTSYSPDEFFPIYQDGELANKTEFVAYKAEQFAGILGHIASRTWEATRIAGSVLLDHIDQGGQ